MKTAYIVLVLRSITLGCPSGSVEHEGVCAAEPEPVLEIHADLSPYVVSDEKPSRHPEPAYQRGEVNVSDGVKERESAQKQDQAIIDAEAQGKKAAGVP